MRHDIGSVIVGHERWSPGGEKGARRAAWRELDDEEIEDLPERAGVNKRWRTRYHADSKEFSDYLSPLYGFLERSVGRSWDAVYGEVRRTVDHRSTLGNHVIEHVKGYVSTDPINRRYSSFYVDDEGILRQKPYRKWKYAPRVNHNVVEIDEFSEYRRLNGCWFFVKLALMPAEPGFIRDAVTKKPIAHHDGPVYHEQSWRKPKRYAESKRQLSKKEIRDADLRAA